MASAVRVGEFLYLTPQTAWLLRAELTGKPVVRAYWLLRFSYPDLVQDSDLEDAGKYRFAFKELSGVVRSRSGNAYALVFTDGSMDDLVSYDRVCVIDRPDPDA